MDILLVLEWSTWVIPTMSDAGRSAIKRRSTDAHELRQHLTSVFRKRIPFKECV
jgi:hypothetical protein